MTERRRLPVAIPTVPRLPLHVLLMFSGATAGYAVTLAAVTGLQASGEAARMADRAPAAMGIAELVAAHEALADRLVAAGEAYGDAAAAYTDAPSVLAVVDRRLAELATVVGEIDGVARDLPTSVRVPLRSTTVRVSVPTTNATTGASGG